MGRRGRRWAVVVGVLAAGAGLLVGPRACAPYVRLRYGESVRFSGFNGGLLGSDRLFRFSVRRELGGAGADGDAAIVLVFRDQAVSPDALTPEIVEAWGWTCSDAGDGDTMCRWWSSDESAHVDGLFHRDELIDLEAHCLLGRSEFPFAVGRAGGEGKVRLPATSKQVRALLGPPTRVERGGWK